MLALMYGFLSGNRNMGKKTEKALPKPPVMGKIKKR